MADRFEFEQKILKFSNILEDLKQLNGKVNSTELNNIINYYQDQHEYLWEMFEQLIKSKQLK